MNYGIISPEIYAPAQTEEPLSIIRTYPELQNANIYIAFPQDILTRKKLFSREGNISWREFPANIEAELFSDIQDAHSNYLHKTAREKQSQRYLSSIGQQNDAINNYLQQEKREWEMIKNAWLDDVFPHKEVDVNRPFYFTPSLKESELEANVKHAFPAYSVSDHVLMLLGKNNPGYTAKDNVSQFLTAS